MLCALGYKTPSLGTSTWTHDKHDPVDMQRLLQMTDIEFRNWTPTTTAPKKTLGQVAFEAYGDVSSLVWEDNPYKEHWERAAQAVLDQHKARQKKDHPQLKDPHWLGAR